MERALILARRAADAGEVPVGAVLVGANGIVLAESGNAPIALHDPSAHAEILVLRAAGAALGNYRLLDTTLYVTLEPCPMCAGALVHARVERLVFATREPKAGAVASHPVALNSWLNHRIEVVEGVLAERSAGLLQRFFTEKRLKAKTLK